MTSTVCVFNAKKFYEMLVSSQNIIDKLDSLRSSCEHHNIQYIFSAVSVLQEVLESRKQLPLTKYNALLTVNQILQASTYIALTLLETYILPSLKQIAILDMSKRSDEELERYFIDLGFRQTVGIRLVSKKYVLLASEVVFSAAVIRPQENILHQEIELPSKAKELFQQARKRSGNQKQRTSKLDLQLQRSKYLKDLKTFDPSRLSSFLGQSLKEEIVFNQGTNGPFRKLIQSEDCFISIPIINTCISLLSSMEKDFHHKKHYLNLFSFYIKQGNIYAIIAAHNAGFIKSIFEEISTVSGNLGLSYGKMIFPFVQGSSQEKYQFYCQFLKSLTIWALCLPKNEVGEVSQIKKMYEYLSKELYFEFPEIIMLEVIITEFAENIQKKQIQNEQILRMMEEDDNVFSKLESIKMKSQISLLKEKIPSVKGKPIESIQPIKVTVTDVTQDSNKKQIAPSAQQKVKKKSSQSTNSSIDDLLQQVEQNLKNLQEKSLVSESMNQLRQFRQEWGGLQKIYSSELSPQTKQKGDKLVLKIGAIEQLFSKFSKKEMSFRIFNYKVLLILEPDDESEVIVKEKSTRQKQKVTVSGIMLEFESNCNKGSKLKGQISSIKAETKSNFSDMKRMKCFESEKAKSSSRNPSDNGIESEPRDFKSQADGKSQKAPSECEKAQELIKHSLVKVRSMKQRSVVENIEPITHNQYNQYGITQLMKKKKEQSSKTSHRSPSQRSSIKTKTIQSKLVPSSEIVPGDAHNSQSLDQYMTISDSPEKVEAKPRLEETSRRSTLSRKSGISSRQKLKKHRQANCLKFEPDSIAKKVKITKAIPIEVQSMEIDSVAKPSRKSQSISMNDLEKVNIDYNNSEQSLRNNSQSLSNNNSCKLSQQNSDKKSRQNFSRDSLQNLAEVSVNNSASVERSSQFKNNMSSSQKLSINNSSSNGVNSSMTNKNHMSFSRQIDTFLADKSASHQNSQSINTSMKKQESKEQYLSMGSQKEESKKEQTEFNKSVEHFFNNEVHQVYQISPTKRQSSTIGQKAKLNKVKGFSRDGVSFQRVVNAITSKSIESYRKYKGSASSKSKSISRNTSESHSLNRSIIRKQFQRMNHSQKPEKNPSMSLTFSNTVDITNHQILPSNLLKEKSSDPKSKAAYSNYELVTSKHSHLFPQKEQNKIVKSCLQSKGVLYESRQLQVGYVHFLKGNQLDFTLFLTAQINLSSVKIKLEGDENMLVSLQTREVNNLVEGRQESVKIQTCMKSMPFRIPVLRLSIKEKKTRKEHEVVLPFPCSVNKYDIFHPVSQEKLPKWTNQNSKLTNFRTYSFKLLKKLEKSGNIQKYLPFFSATKGDLGGIRYISEFSFGAEQGLVELIQEDKHAWHIAGRGEGRSRFMEFILSSFFFLMGE